MSDPLDHLVYFVGFSVESLQYRERSDRMQNSTAQFRRETSRRLSFTSGRYARGTVTVASLVMNCRYVAPTFKIGLVFWLFQRGQAPEGVLEEEIDTDNADSELRGIRCPQCLWRPQPSSRWECTDCGEPEFFFGGCGAVWNTFTTRGCCPGCDHQWRWTMCLSCWQWSLHEEWYVGG